LKPVSVENKLPQKNEINISIERDDESDDQDNNIEEKSPVENEVKVKTLEQIRMEKILNDSPENSNQESVNKTDDLKTSETRIAPRRSIRASKASNNTNISQTVATPVKNEEKECVF